MRDCRGCSISAAEAIVATLTVVVVTLAYAGFMGVLTCLLMRTE